jgi:hypothetical protein
MKSRPFFALNVGFATIWLVAFPSYYFCVKKRDYKEQLIQVMMRANDFQEAREMPPEIPAGEEHPFLDDATTIFQSNDNDTTAAAAGGGGGGGTMLTDREFVGHLPERKEWQTQVPQQDAKDVFVEKK